LIARRELGSAAAASNPPLSPKRPAALQHCNFWLRIRPGANAQRRDRINGFIAVFGLRQPRWLADARRALHVTARVGFLTPLVFAKGRGDRVESFGSADTKAAAKRV